MLWPLFFRRIAHPFQVYETVKAVRNVLKPETGPTGGLYILFLFVFFKKK